MNFMQTAICLLPVIPMRKEPSHRSEMVSQLLFGEYVKTGEEKNEFVLVKCDYDGYEGWVQAKQLSAVNGNEILQTDVYTASFATPATKNNTMLYVPYGSSVFQQRGFGFKAAGFDLTYLLQPQQTWNSKQQKLTVESLEAAYQPYLNAPYLWGGKSVYGTDCSGFAQQIFKLFGVKLLRDAYLQAEQGTAVASLPEAQLGDLAFFQNEKGRVTHVGIVLNEGKIVHASGEVRIDQIDANGILNSLSGERTHVMHSIRRFSF
ncbi:C40 family peptidase [Flavisolibacter ginsenosidimutans]|uniref:NlpC/P60 family protein n=1 Tax=Flavisolibacter ginsenosidimutans TaxID=661481 RepID=A0A5B8UG57_9BACT|nr:C40 family peptidase [Flavisolibacter ginsenosidimutans]QEC55637.1 NlpC/P60 family protein [Flavisolibacter ginsenosidimutans]